jgi:hypothetical protein
MSATATKHGHTATEILPAVIAPAEALPSPEAVEEAVWLVHRAATEVEGAKLAAMAAHMRGIVEASRALVEATREHVRLAADPGWRGERAISDASAAASKAVDLEREARKLAERYVKLLEKKAGTSQ